MSIEKSGPLPLTCSHFEGCLLGGLIGDCLGFPFENEFEHQYSNPKIEQFFEGLKMKKASPNNIMQYTDDTSMTKSVAQQLIVSGPTVNPFLLSKIFVEMYSKETWDRNYPPDVLEVLEELKKSGGLDPFRPATMLNGGQGSVSNAPAARVAPIVLTEHLNPNSTLVSLIESVIICARVTHSHPSAIMGAVFQAMAIRQALKYSQNTGSLGSEIAMRFLDEFTTDFEGFRTGTEYKQFFADETFSHKSLSLYIEKLVTMKDLLKGGNDLLDVKSVMGILGVKIRAVDSVATALYIFLAAFQPIPFIPTENQFGRTIQLAICLGGDTDTIGAMAGSIAGAYLGKEKIPEDLLKHCEDGRNVQELAQKLYQEV